MNSLVSVSAVATFSETAIISNLHNLCQYSYDSFIWGFKNKTKFGEINISESNFLSSGYGNESWLWKIYQTEYGPFLAFD